MIEKSFFHVVTLNTDFPDTHEIKNLRLYIYKYCSQFTCRRFGIDNSFVIAYNKKKHKYTMLSDELAHLSKVYSVIAGACISIFHCILNNFA